MPIQPPNLDDRRTADLVAEARTLIPRYVPEWTDLNESDPGIALLELFAWMTDILIYRLNLVPERNYLKFLQLLGIEQEPAQPANADLTFTLAPTVLDSVIVPRGTKVGAAGSLIFETTENLIALGSALQDIQSFDGLDYTIQTRKNAQPGQDFHPFGTIAREGNTLMLGFDASKPFTDQSINLTVYTSGLDLAMQGLHCNATATLDALPAVLVWEFWSGQQWLPLDMDKDETLAFTRDGHIFFWGPGDRCQSAQLGAVPEKLYWMRARLVKSSYQLAPALNMILINTIQATQAVTVQAEILGASNGLPSQQFQLANAPIVAYTNPRTITEPFIASNTIQPDTPTTVAPSAATTGLWSNITINSLWLQVDEGQGPQSWQEVSDFYASGPEDRHYTLNRSTGEITFGDGLHGHIPLATEQSDSIVAREYSYGGGSQGNVGANTIIALQDSLPGVESVTNLQPAFGGRDEETLEDAKKRTPLVLKSKGRAVTAEDFEFIAVQTPGAMIQRAKALPLTHPRFPGQKLPGVVTVIVVPVNDPASKLPPMPTPATLSLVCAYLDQHRLLTTEVYIVPPTYHEVRIDASLVINPAANLAIVRQNVIKSLQNYFDPLIGGDDGQGWPFGGTIYFSKLYRVVMEVDGVDYIHDNQFAVYVDGLRYSYQDVAIEAGSLLYFNDYDIRLLSL